MNKSPDEWCNDIQETLIRVSCSLCEKDCKGVHRCFEASTRKYAEAFYEEHMKPLLEDVPT